eukprot:5377900-Prymnesium_polylepis.1
MDRPVSPSAGPTIPAHQRAINIRTVAAQPHARASSLARPPSRATRLLHHEATREAECGREAQPHQLAHRRRLWL